MPEADTPHEISLAVWDLATPLIVNRRAGMKVGAKCSAGCPLTGRQIEIHNEAGAMVAGAALGPALWPGTSALYWSELSVPAPCAPGAYSWGVILESPSPADPHAGASSSFSFLSVPVPDHTVRVIVIEKTSQRPLPQVLARLGPFRVTTDDSGIALLEAPKGSYELAVWKAGYEALPMTVDVKGDVTVQIEIQVAAEPESEYWMG